MVVLTLDGLVEECLAAAQEPAGPAAVSEVLRRVVVRPGDLEAALGSPTAAGETTLFSSPGLTVALLVWGPGMVMYPHDHRMWTAIAVHRGVERNVFHRRSGDGLETVGTEDVGTGEVALLDADAVHSVVNPTAGITAAVHVFGGDLVRQPRSEWDWETLTERPYDDAHAQRLFDEANARAAGASPEVRT